MIIISQKALSSFPLLLLNRQLLAYLKWCPWYAYQQTWTEKHAASELQVFIMPLWQMNDDSRLLRGDWYSITDKLLCCNF